MPGYVADRLRAAALRLRRLILDEAIPRSRTFVVERAIPASRRFVVQVLVPAATRVVRDEVIPLARRLAAASLRVSGGLAARADAVLEVRAPRLAAALRRIPGRLRPAIAIGLVAVVVIGVVVAATRPAPERNAAAAFLDGRYVGPPYEVKVENGDIVVNGILARAKPWVEQAPAAAPADPKDAYDLAMVAGQKISKPGTTEAEVDAAIADLKARPATASVEKSQGSILITDRQGQRTRVLYGIRELPTEERVLESQRAVAARWQRSLNDGGVLLTAEGVEVTVPAQEAPAFLVGLGNAFAQAGPERMDMLVRVTGSVTVAESVLRAGPSTELKERISFWPVERGDAPARFGLMSRSQADADGAATPGSKRAYAFDYFQDSRELDYMRDALERTGYTLVEFTGFFQHGEHWIREFASIGRSGGAGLIYVSVHGMPEGLAFEGFGQAGGSGARDLVVVPRDRQAPMLKQRIQEYVSSGEFRATELESAYDGTWYLMLLKAGISRVFKDEGTIVYLSTCHGWLIRDAFVGARAVIGPLTITHGYEAEAINKTLFPGLDGTKGDGDLRPFAKAATQALADYEKERPRLAPRGGTATWQFAETAPTVLAPAVGDVAPRGPVAPKKSVSGRVHFDVPMDTRVPAVSVLDLRGCGARLTEGSLRWQDPQTLSFTIETTREGTLALTVVGPAARSAGAGIQLLGKLQQKDVNVGRDFTWTVPCEPGALGERPAEVQTRLGQFTASTDRAKVGERVTLTLAVSSGDSWHCAGEFHVPGGVRSVRIGDIPGAKLVDWSPKQLSRSGSRIEGPPQAGPVTWWAGDANPEPPNCREAAAQGRAPSGLFKSGDVFSATYEVTSGTGDWVRVEASVENEQGVGEAVLPFASTGVATPSPTPAATATARPTATRPTDPAVLLRRCPADSVTPDRARQFVGQEVTLCYPVWLTRPTQIGSTILWSQEGPTRVAAVIPKTAVERLTERYGELASLTGVLVTITGRLEVQDGVPAIMVTSTTQLSFPFDAAK